MQVTTKQRQRLERYGIAVTSRGALYWDGLRLGQGAYFAAALLSDLAMQCGCDPWQASCAINAELGVR